jgi:Flp pilus assembly protein TadD
MQGILAVKQIVDKKPDFVYGQIILGLGDIKSGQTDKAIERFQLVANKQPDNLEAIFHLAELYEQKGDKANAVKWYKAAAEQIKVPQIKKEIEERIKALQ